MIAVQADRLEIRALVTQLCLSADGSCLRRTGQPRVHEVHFRAVLIKRAYTPGEMQGMIAEAGWSESRLETSLQLQCARRIGANGIGRSVHRRTVLCVRSKDGDAQKRQQLSSIGDPYRGDVFPVTYRPAWFRTPDDPGDSLRDGSLAARFEIWATIVRNLAYTWVTERWQFTMPKKS